MAPAAPKKKVSKAPPVTSTFKNDKQWIKQQINQLVKLTNKKGVNGAKERAIWSQIDNLRNALGTLNAPKRKSLERKNGYMTLPNGTKVVAVKGVMMNDNEARAALNPGGPGAAMPGKPTPTTPKTTPKEPWTVRKPGGAAGDWVVTPSGAAELERAGIRRPATTRPVPGSTRPRGAGRGR
jgi:hypothetical protein